MKRQWTWNAICSKCKIEKDHTNFSIHSNGKPRTYCKVCLSLAGKKYRDTSGITKFREALPKEEKIKRSRVAMRKWRKSNLAYDAMRQRERTAQKLRAMPSWANRVKIKEIYENCPSGYHVDHIIPLRNSIVSGLHNEFNLQYLPALENIRKKNYYEA